MQAPCSKFGDSLESEYPRRFGPLVLVERIGQGGMADIYLALEDTGLAGPRRVVVKVVRPLFADNPAFADMLVSEARVAARLSHRNIVRVLHLGRAEGQLYMVMDYVEGYDLNQLLRQLSRRKLRFPAQFALFIARELLTALHFAHRVADDTGRPLGLVHGDISPSNVLVSFEGEVRLCDFGIARASTGPERGDVRTLGEAPAGKCAYMAPERARGQGGDARSDLFAAGVLLWELCAGRRLRRGDEGDMLALARAGTVLALPERGLPLHDRLGRLLSRALSTDPATRFQSAGEMLDEVSRYAFDARLMASELRFGRFLSQHLADGLVDRRRALEGQAAGLLPGPGPAAQDRPPVVPAGSAGLPVEPMGLDVGSHCVW